MIWPRCTQKKIVEKTTSPINHFKSRINLIDTLLSKDDNLYIVGLDSHVGFILRRGQSVYFIHSNYYGSEGPVKEMILSSQVFKNSESYYVGTFLTDQNLKKWLDESYYSLK